MDTGNMMDYLAALDTNNNREWFHANKVWYQEAKETFEMLVTALMIGVRSFDANIPMSPAKELTFKLMRDTRFSHDKRPYNASFRAHIGRAGKLPIPCDYYVSLRPGEGSFLGGGLFAPMFADATRRIRDAIAEKGAEFERIVGEMGYNVQGEALKRVPKEYDATCPQAEYLKNKSWYVEVNIPDALVREPDAFVREAVAVFQRIQPFNTFLNEALDGFVMPTR